MLALSWLLACAPNPGSFFLSGADAFGRSLDEAVFVADGDIHLTFGLPTQALEGFELRVADPEILELVTGPDADFPEAPVVVAFRSGGPGTTRLELVDLDTDEVVALTEVVVEEATEVALVIPDPYFAFVGFPEVEPVLVTGIPTVLRIESSSEGTRLAGELVGSAPCEDGTWQVERQGSTVMLVANTAGVHRVPACAGVSATSIEVIDPSDVHALTWLERENDEGAIELFAVAEDEGGRPVLGVEPTWTGWIGGDKSTGEVYRYEADAQRSPTIVTAAWGDLVVETTVHQGGPAQVGAVGGCMSAAAPMVLWPLGLLALWRRKADRIRTPG